MWLPFIFVILPQVYFPFTLADVTVTNIFRGQLYTEWQLQIAFEVNAPTLVFEQETWFLHQAVFNQQYKLSPVSEKKAVKICYYCCKFQTAGLQNKNPF